MKKMFWKCDVDNISQLFPTPKKYKLLNQYYVIRNIDGSLEWKQYQIICKLIL